MASGESVVKLRIDSKEYDANIKRAGDALQQYFNRVRDGGGTLEHLDEGVLEAVKAMGELGTKAGSTKGALAELTNATTEMIVRYRSLTDAERATPLGETMSKSISQLTARVKETKTSLDAATASLQDNGQAAAQSGGFLDGLTSKFTINIDAMKLFSVGMQAAAAAVDVAKEAFFQSESNIDEWGRTLDGARGAYDYFLQALNSGNWSNFFTNLNTAIQGGRDLYDALDRLGSVKANNAAAIALAQQQVAILRLAKQQGKEVDDQLKSATEQLAYLQNQSVAAGKTAGHMDIVNTLTNRINAQNTTGVNVSSGTIRGVAGSIEKGGQDAIDKYTREYYQLRQKGLETVQHYDSLTKSYYDAEVFNLANLTKSEQKRYLIAEAVTESETRIQKGLAIYAQAVQEGSAAAREEFKGNRYAMQGGGGAGTKATPQDQARKQIEDAQYSYAQSLEKARMSLDNGTITEADYKKRTLSAEEQLWAAYGKAYQTYSDPAYKEAQDATAKKILELGSEVTAAVEAQKNAAAAARELEQAQKKLATAEEELAAAQATGDLKQIYAAQGKVDAAQSGLSRLQSGGTEGAAVSVPVLLTTSNLDAFTSHLKEQISKTDLGSSLMATLQEQLSDATAISDIMSVALKNGIDTASFDTAGLMKKLLNGENIDDTAIQEYVDLLNEKLKEKYDETEWPKVLIKFNVDTKQVEGLSKNLQSDASNLANSWAKAGSAIQAVGNAISAIEDPAVKVMGTIAQAIASVALGAAQAIKDARPGNTGGPWAWIAFAASATATMISTIAAIHSATGYANGGIVSGAAGGVVTGDSFSGDRIGNVRLDAGELILNRVQQGVLAQELEGGGMKGIGLTTRINAEDIEVVMNNRYSRTGLGEIVTSEEYY